MKLFLKLLVALFLLLILGVLAFLLFFDPNAFKPRLEALAREQNVALSINGDMNWQLWPPLAIEVNGVQAAALETPDQPIARVGRAALRLALVPLLRGEVEVDHVIVEGAVFDLVVDEQGRGNWEALLPNKEPNKEPEEQPEQQAEQPPAETPAEQPQTEQEGSQLQLAVEQISLRNSALNYTAHRPEAEGGGTQNLTLSDIQLEVEDFNLVAEPFPVSLHWVSEISDPALFGEQTVMVTGDMMQTVRLPAELNEVAIRNGKLNLQVAGGNNQSSDLNLTYDMTLTGLDSQMAYEGQVNVGAFNAKQLLAALAQEVPATAEDYALTDVALQAHLSGDDQSLTVDPITLTLDQTRLEGRVAVTNFSTGALDIALHGDQMNVDDYLPPPSEEPEPAEQPAATGDEVIIPLDSLRALTAKAAFDFQKLTIAGLKLEQPTLEVTANNGLIRLNRAGANAYGGTLAASGSLDARGDTAVIDFESGVQSLQLAPLLKDQELDQNIELRGALDAAANGSTRGVTLNELMDSARAEATFSGAEVQVAPINIEQMFCQVVDLVTQGDGTDQNWPDFTEMRQLTGRATIADGVVSIEQLTAGVEQLAVALQGVIDLKGGDYNIGLPLTLMDSSTSASGCQVRSNYWLDRTLTLLRCRGSLEGLNPLSDCRPDSEGLTELVKQYAAHQIREKHGDKIERAEQKLEEAEQQAEQKVDEKKEELESELQEKLDREGKRVEDRLKRLLGR